MHNTQETGAETAAPDPRSTKSRQPVFPAPLAAQEIIIGKPMRYAEYAIDVPFLDYLDIMVVVNADESVNLTVQLERQHMNGGMVTHGGVVMTLLDMAMAAAGRRNDPTRRVCVTVEMKSNFLQPGGAIGDRLLARGFLRHSSRSLAFCDGEVRNQHGELLATASGTFKYMNKTGMAADI